MARGSGASFVWISLAMATRVLAGSSCDRADATTTHSLIFNFRDADVAA